MANTKSILVTGGLGLIGHNVVQRLCAQGHDVVVTDTRTSYGIIPQTELAYLMRERIKLIPATVEVYRHDIANTVGISSIMRDHRIDTVVHMASFPRQKVVNHNPQLGSRTMRVKDC